LISWINGDLVELWQTNQKFFILINCQGLGYEILILESFFLKIKTNQLSNKKLTLSKLQEALVKTLEITALIMVLVAASNFFGAVFARLGTPTLLTEFLLGLEMNKYLILAMVMVMIFLLGWPLEWVPIVMIFVPIILPLIEALGFNLTWFAILVAVNLQTAWLSPPVALSAYFLKGVVPEWDLKDIYYGMMQFMVLQVIGLVLIKIFPKNALWLPTLLYGQ